MEPTTMSPPLTRLIDEAERQLAAERAKRRRLDETIRQRETRIIRLWASQAMGQTPPARSGHE